MTGRQCETAQIVLTDMHYGKHTTSYSPDECVARLGRLTDKLARFRDLLTSSYQIDKLIVHLGGDENDGTEIFPGQSHEQDLSNVEAQANDWAAHMADWLKAQKEIWGCVEVEAVPGNHGRAGRFAHTAANWDLVAYRYLSLRQQWAPVRFNDWAATDIFVRMVPVRGHVFLLYHGHDVRSYANIPYYGITQRLTRWFSSSSRGGFDVALFGHFHAMGYHTWNRIQILLSGSMVSGDDWGLRTFGLESACKTWFWGTSNKYPITWQYGIDLT